MSTGEHKQLLDDAGRILWDRAPAEDPSVLLLLLQHRLLDQLPQPCPEAHRREALQVSLLRVLLHPERQLDPPHAALPSQAAIRDLESACLCS